MEATTLRKEIERLVISSNKILRDTVSSMDIIILLRNLHPTLRPEFARKLKTEGVITEKQMLEFTIQN
jgi:hypothetical protein